MILSLQPPDTIHLQAAQGWIELGNHVEANEELEKITARLRVHPDLLELRWRIFAAAKNWEAALDIASALIQIDPENPAGWEVGRIHWTNWGVQLKRETICFES